jgi:hypothetical protein
MSPDLKLLLTIIITLIIMFATTLLLEIPLVQAETVRKLIVYLLVVLEFFIGFQMVRFQLKK